MRFLGRWIFRFTILMILLIIGLLLCKDALLKSWIESKFKSEAGVEVRIGKMEIGIFSPTATFLDFRLYNSPEFGGSVFLTFPELHIEYDRDALARKRLHIKLLRINLSEIHMVENGIGESNLKAFMIPANTNNLSGLEFDGIDMLNLSAGKVIYTDMRNPSKTREVQLGIQNELIRNVRSGEDLSLLVGKILWQKGGELFWGSPAPENRLIPKKK